MVAEGNVVKDFYIGHTHIKICDDSCRDTTPEQIDDIMTRIARLAISSMRRAASEEKRICRSDFKKGSENHVQQKETED